MTTIDDGRPVVFRRGTVLTMNDAHEVLHDADVLVVGDKIAAVGPDLEVPEGAHEIDASRGIVMPGMVDTHRHMWQTAMRGYGADWTLTQYFVFYYLEWGKIFRPQDIYAGNLLSAIESLDAGVTTTTPTRPSTPCRRSPAASSSPTATSSRAPGSGRGLPTSAASSTAGSARATTCWASRWPST